MSEASIEGDLLKEFAKGLAGNIGGDVGTLLFGAFFPTGQPFDVDALCDRLKEIITEETEKNDVDLIKGALTSTLDYVHNIYSELKKNPNYDLDYLQGSINPFVDKLSDQCGLLKANGSEWIRPNSDWSSIPGLTVFILAGNTYLALLQEKAMVDSKAKAPGGTEVIPWYSGFAPAVRNTATTLCDTLEPIWSGLQSRRSALITVVSRDHRTPSGPFGGDSWTSYRWEDAATGRVGEWYSDDDNDAAGAQAQGECATEQARALAQLREQNGDPDAIMAAWQHVQMVPLPSPASHLNRQSFQCEGTQYLVLDGVFRAVDNLTRTLLFVESLAPTAIEKTALFPLGIPITYGAILAGGDTKAYLVVDGTKRWIPSGPIFEGYGFDWNLVRTLPLDSLAAIPDGPDTP